MRNVALIWKIFWTFTIVLFHCIIKHQSTYFSNFEKIKLILNKTPIQTTNRKFKVPNITKKIIKREKNNSALSVIEIFISEIKAK